MQARQTQIIMHSLAFSLVLVEEGVAVVGNPFEDGCLAGAGRALGAGGEHSEPSWVWWRL